MKNMVSSTVAPARKAAPPKDYRLVDVTGLMKLIEQKKYVDNHQQVRLARGAEFDIAKFLLDADNVKLPRKVRNIRLIKGQMNDVNDEAIRLINDGWEMQGGMTPFEHDYELYYFQTMVRFD